ncbi:glycosyltransferase family 39 protein [Chloroflexus sp. Y-396-1]|uniref:ArnT family glycosyltransferase n=1 Tax=Chloroflexus sp. Y-396-1 TaxID=867845 RepID=UPI00048D4913|nr:glycosyltransferase family 39 protein [Chloroflexus sp. Y-396-1]
MQTEQLTQPNPSTTTTDQTILCIAKILLLALSCIAIGTYLYVALSRISFPFAVEWVESNTFIQVVQILNGRPIYTYPSFDFIPTIYTPLYYYIVALFAKFTQQIMFSMRFVSLLASITIFVMIYKICRQRGMSRESSFVAIGLFAASYGVVGYWFDIGRVDTLFLAFLLVSYALTITQAKPDSLYGMLAGLTLFLSFATKQPALGVTPFIVGYLVVQKRWLKALWLSCSFLVAWTGFVFFMNITSDGWFWTYTFSIPATHPILWETLFNFWTLYILPKFSLLLIIPIFSILILFLQRSYGWHF